jgi:hypothetical protein
MWRRWTKEDTASGLEFLLEMPHGQASELKAHGAVCRARFPVNSESDKWYSPNINLKHCLKNRAWDVSMTLKRT